MCGIAGFVAAEPQLGEGFSKAARGSIRYRGLDSEGSWISQCRRVGLFHSRLAVIDLESGTQPMKDSSGRFIITFNGEIYNYPELKQLYTSEGAIFHSESDTEVILEGFKLRGDRVCEDLNGMFAFAIWDTSQNRFFLARDRLGKKPLYWTNLGRVFYFSSSLDAFRGIPDWTGELSHLNLDAYAALGNYLPGQTAFKQARSLPGGCFAVVDPKDRTPKISRYWRLDFSKKIEMSDTEAIERFDELIASAVTIRLRADVPVGLTFSGGVDSGIIAAVAKKHTGRELPCWTIDYDTDLDQSEETAIARKVALQLGLQWHYKHFDYHTELIPALRRALEFVDQPCGHIAISYSRQLYAEIRPEAKVVLCGNGADELFLGYNGNEQLVSKDQSCDHPSPLRYWWRKRRSSAFARHQSDRTNVLAEHQTAYIRSKLGRYTDDDDPEEHVKAIHVDIVASRITSHADLYTYMGLNFYSFEANFRIPDVIGLSEQVEVRSPFLDYRIVEFAAALPTRFKVRDTSGPNSNKFILKQYYERFVPREVAWARKKGMGWNLKYDQTLATDPNLVGIYRDLLGKIKNSGLPDEGYREAWESFVHDKKRGIAFPSSSGPMSAGLMLGLWLEKQQTNAINCKIRSRS